MGTLAQKQDTSKLLSMVDNVVVLNRAYRRVRRRADAVAREQEYGRLNKSINDLAETAEQFSKDAQP